MIKINGSIYYDGFGKLISKEEWEREREKFEAEVEFAYNIKANEILTRISSIATSDIDKLWLLYDYLTGENMQYDLQGTSNGGVYAREVKYNFPPYTNWKISSATKYPALLNNSGVCITFSLAFEDLANKLGIPCRVVYGFTGMEHAWNIVLINNEIKYIDIAYALIYKKFIDKRQYFLKNIGELGNRILRSSIDELTADMETQFNQFHPKIRKFIIQSPGKQSEANLGMRKIIIQSPNVKQPELTGANPGMRKFTIKSGRQVAKEDADADKGRKR